MIRKFDSVADALAAADLDFTAELRAVQFASEGGYGLAEKHRVVVRTDTEAALGVVGHQYHLVQHADACAWVEQALGRGVESVERALRDNGGGRMMLELRLPGDYELPGGDVVTNQLIVGNSVDGSLALVCTPTTKRLVCENQTVAFVSASKMVGVYARHTSGAVGRGVGRIDEMLAKVSESHAEFRDSAMRLAAKSIDSAAVDRLFRGVASRHAESCREAVVDDLRERFESHLNAGGFGATAWTAWNSITEAVNHGGRDRGEESERAGRRSYSLFYGQGARVMQQAWQAVLAL